MLDWPHILTTLVQNIEQRLAQDIQTTEDTVRYYFFLHLITSGIEPQHMILERSHPEIEQKQIDLSVIRPEGVWDFEVKYHRPIPSGRNRPRTQLRGQVFSDLYKLALSDNQRGYMLYLADPMMATHWKRYVAEFSTYSGDTQISLTPEWLRMQPVTLRRVIRNGLGSTPQDVVVDAQAVAAEETHDLSAWLYRVAPAHSS